MMMLAPVLTPHGLLTLRQTERGAGVGARAGLAAGEGVCTGLRAWTVVPGRRRGRDGSASGAVVLAGAWGALRDRTVRSSRYRRGPYQAACADPRGRRVGHDGRGRSAHDRRGIPDDGCPGRSLARHGCGLRCRAGCKPSSPCRSSSRAVIRPGTWSGASISILPRTGRTRTPRSRSLRPTRHGFRPRPRPSICRSARPCRSMPARGTASACCRC